MTRTRVRQESWQRIGGASPPRGRSSQPPRPRVMHEVLSARTAVTLVHRASRQWIERPREEFHCDGNLIGRPSQYRKRRRETPAAQLNVWRFGTARLLMAPCGCGGAPPNQRAVLFAGLNRAAGVVGAPR